MKQSIENLKKQIIEHYRTKEITLSNQDAPTTPSVEQVGSDALLAPIWYALGSIVATPLLALMMLVFAAFLVCAWPFIPFLCWGKRREEIRKANVRGCRPDDENA